MKMENESSNPSEIAAGCKRIDKTGVTLIVTVSDNRGSFGPFPVDLAVHGYRT